MKKQILLLALLLSVAASAFAAEVEIDGLWYEVVSKAKEAKVIQYKNNVKYSGNIVIPETVVYDGDSYRVTSIGDYTFLGCSGLTSITIPGSVTSIGNSAFYGCSGLTSVTIPNSLTSIGNYVLCGCSSLTSVKISNNITSIGYGAFAGCGLTSVIIPNSVMNIGGYAFSGCNTLTTITIGNGIETIETEAFAHCPKLTDVYCYAENVPVMKDSDGDSGSADAFYESNYRNATLHVPMVSIDSYKATIPWKWFKNFEGMETLKCATPTIAFIDGKLKFSCETQGVEYVSEVTVGDAKKNYSSEVSLTGIYKVSVYATKAGYDNSDVATMEFTLGSGGEVCDVNKDGQVDVADIAAIISRMAGK